MRTMMLRLFCTLMILLTTGSVLLAQDDPAPSFNNDIRPILSDRCFACHGPDAESREAGLRLDQADGDEGAHAIAIVPGSLEDSPLWERVNSDDESELMPPLESHKPRLSKTELKLVKRWIENGANFDGFWAFQLPKKSATPVVKNESWSDNLVDLYVLRGIEKAGLEPAPAAELRLLIRRVTLGLTGLPPTRAEIQAFLEACENAGVDVAWENLIDQLLRRDQFGEHVGRYWLDVVRFADTNGMHKDFYRNNVAYRDWVVRAFNENLKYDDFIRFQIAGDLYENPTRDQMTATGFHRLHLIIDRGTALPEESFHKNVIDRVTSISTGFMGLTAHCAQCHDHKYDPLTQKDFYSLYAFFNNLDAEPETVANPKFGLQEPFVSFGSSEQEARLAGLNQDLKKLDAEVKNLKSQIAIQESAKKQFQADEAARKKEAAEKEAAELKAMKKESEQEPVSGDAEPDVKNKESTLELTQQETPETQLPADQKTAPIQEEEKPKGPVYDEAKLAAWKLELSELQANQKPITNQRNTLDREIPRAMVMKERDEVRPTFVRVRGQYDAPGEEVQRNTPGFLPALKQSGEVPTRMDFAHWLVAEENPLTARVTVNRFWQQLCGVGIVKTSEDLGAQGEFPSHPELLDYLAVSFVESGWDVKALIKQIVMTKTYRQSSRATAESFARDPENRLLARGPRYRLDAEVVRDQILATSGLLSKKMYGPSVRPPQPEGLWKAVSMTGERFRADTGDAIYRRSLYTFWKRGMPPPQMTIMNAPIRDACITRRERTNTPSQALLLLNEKEYLNAARELAKQVLTYDEQDRIGVAWEVVTCQLPDEMERETIARLLEELIEKYNLEPELAEQLCLGAGLAEGDSKPKLAAWTIVINTLYNLDITKTLE